MFIIHYPKLLTLVNSHWPNKSEQNGGINFNAINENARIKLII